MDHGIAQSRKDVERGNRSAPRAADVGGATADSVKQSSTKTNQDPSDVEELEAAFEAQTGKRKRQQRPAEAKAAADAPTPPSAANSGYLASDPWP